MLKIVILLNNKNNYKNISTTVISFFLYIRFNVSKCIMFYGINKKNPAYIFDDQIQLVKKIAYKIRNKFSVNLHIDDLIQSGMIGLLEAHKNFNPNKGANFFTYATIRIQGSILDEIRKNNWAPRSFYKKYKDITNAQKILNNKYGRVATSAEISKYLQIHISEYYNLMHNSLMINFLSLEEINEFGEKIINFNDNDNILPRLEFNDLKEKIYSLIKKLNDSEKMVIVFYYHHDFNLKKISYLLSLSESRICQIHASALNKLKKLVSEIL